MPRSGLTRRAGRPIALPIVLGLAFLASADGRGFSKEFDSGGTEEEGYGSHVGGPAWGPKPR